MRAIIRILAFVLLALPAKAADPNQPHTHQGILQPFHRGKPEVELDAKQREQLQKGKPVLIQHRDSNKGGRAMAIMDIHATPQQVMRVIADFTRYPDWIGEVKECEVYATEGDHVLARYRISGIGFNFTYYLDHVFHRDVGWMSWTLDYSRLSDLDDSVGFWYLEPHPEREGWTRGYYSASVCLPIKLPGPIMGWITKSGLKSATGWVKRESEKLAQQES